MNLLLISKTPIVIQIFELVCKKLQYNLNVTNTNDVKNHYDIIVVDNEFVDDRFNIIRQLSKSIGAITNDDLSQYTSKHFCIKRPFLPTQLLEVLKEQEIKVNNYKDDSVIDDYNEDFMDETTQEVAAFVDSLGDDLGFENEDEDESIVTLESLNDGGVLDSFELSKINNILTQAPSSTSYQEDIELEEHDWKELSDIIDDALDEVKGYEFSITNNPINIALNHYHMEELRPLLEKFDQHIIDKLSSGQTIDLKLSLKAKA